jgi:glutathione S-transferase
MTFIPSSVQKVELAKGIQKQPWFLRLNPNGLIPVLLDRKRSPPPSISDADGFPVFESPAILLYLSQHFDTDNKFGWNGDRDPEHHSEMLQWIFWGTGLVFMQSQGEVIAT